MSSCLCFFFTSLSPPTHSFFFTIFFQWTLTGFNSARPVMKEMEVVVVKMVRVFIIRTVKGFGGPL